MNLLSYLFISVFVALTNGSIIKRAKRQSIITGGGTGVDASYLASLLSGNTGNGPAPVINTGSGQVPGAGGTRTGLIQTEPPTTLKPTPPPTTKPSRGTRKPRPRSTRKPKPTSPATTTTPTPEPTTMTELVFVDTTTYVIPDTTTFRLPVTTEERVTEFGVGDFFSDDTEEPAFGPDEGFGEESEEFSENRGELPPSTTPVPRGRVLPGDGDATKFGPVSPPDSTGNSQGIIPLLPEVSGGTNAEFFGVDAGTKKGFANGQGGKSAGAAIPGLGFFGGSKGGGLQGCGKVGGGKSVGIGNFGSVNRGTSVDLSAIPGIGKVLGEC